MHERTDQPATTETIPIGQRLFENVYLLMAAGLFVVFVLYTGWGIWEIVHLPAARLP